MSDCDRLTDVIGLDRRCLVMENEVVKAKDGDLAEIKEEKS